MTTIGIAVALPQSEAEDIRVRLMNWLENFRPHAVIECGLADVAHVCGQMIPKFSAVNAPHQPDLQGIEALRAGDGELAKIRPAPL